MLRTPDQPESTHVDDDAPLIERLDGTPPKSASDHRLLWRLAALVTLLVLLGVGAVNLWWHVRPLQYSASRATLDSPGPGIPAGWEHLGPADASDIVFSQSQPYAAYACGPSASPTAANPPAAGINIYYSSTYGHSWVQFATPTMGVACRITVDPLNAFDVVLFVDVHRQCTTFTDVQIWRSADGGHDWTQWSLPPGPGQPFVANTATWGWAGSTLFLEAATDCSQSPTLLAVSRDGGQFVWISPSALLAGTQDFAYLGPLQASQFTMYVTLEPSGFCPACLIIKRSSDGGRSWMTFAPTFQGQPLYLDSVGTGAGEPNGLLFARLLSPAPPRFIVSRDAGATWQTLPPFGSDLSGLNVGQIEAVPDGSYYAALAATDSSRTAEAGIYRLAPGASTWMRVASYPAGRLVVSYSDSGTAMGLWALVPLLGSLIYHQP